MEYELSLLLLAGTVGMAGMTMLAMWSRWWSLNPLKRDRCERQQRGGVKVES
jgi:hypothetical protein